MSSSSLVPARPADAVDLKRVRRRMSRVNRMDVVAWDGEGLTEDGRHRYVLLANSLGLDVRARGGLTTLQCLDAVWRTGVSRPGALHVMYGAGYDWEYWLHGVDRETAVALYKTHPIKLGPFTVRYNGIWFEVFKGRHSVVVWDLWKFWGTGFEAALKAHFPDFHGLQVIHEFKRRRGAFTWDTIEEVAHYNRLELEGLVLLTRQLFEDLAVAGVRAPAYLTGAGALAGALHGAHGTAEHVGDQGYGSPEVEDAVHRAFAAGRVDPWRVGHHVGPCWQHDLRSAYPTAMLDLPSMASGSWEWREKHSEAWADRLSVWLVSWSWVDRKDPKPPTKRYFPFFYRTRQGSILFPPAGMGWQWWPEVTVAQELGWKFRVHGGWVWRPDEPDVRPFAWVPALYAKRASLKAAGKEGAQRVLKYGLNSLYGKLCQAQGSTVARPPKYHNLAWAGWITSATRARIMEAAALAPDAVCYQMTDSVMALERLPLDEGPALGQWEVEEYDRALVVQAGVGSLWKGDQEYPKYRGFDAGTVSAKGVLRAWQENHENGYQLPLQTTAQRLVTLGSALTGSFDEWGQWPTAPRDLHLYGGDGKRLPGLWQSMRPWETTCPLEPTPVAIGNSGAPLAGRDLVPWLEAQHGDALSARYQPRWASEDPWALPEVTGRLRRDMIDRDVSTGEQR